MKKYLLSFLSISFFITLKAQSPVFYGMTSSGNSGSVGSIFRYNADDADTGFKTIYPFYNEPHSPTGNVIQVSDSLLYGMTIYGGANNGGTIFSYNIYTHVETDEHDFGNGGDGSYPFGSLIKASNGLLFGMTSGGGAKGCGIIFSFNSSTKKEINLHDFGNGSDGEDPFGSLLQVTDSLLYGLTSWGGTNAQYGQGGVIFSYNILNGSYNVLHDFGVGYDGADPNGTLIRASNGLLYGVTVTGGGGSRLFTGTIFSYNISTGVEESVHTFGTDTDGSAPFGALIQVNDSLLCGTTEEGGVNDSGTIYSYNILTNSETTLYAFKGGSDGTNPTGSLMLASNGLLYGMTERHGGANDAGVLFDYDFSTKAENILYNFNNTSQLFSSANNSLIQASNGFIYGVSGDEGDEEGGLIFSYFIPTNTESDVYDFGIPNNGQNPCGSLTQASNGLFYGMTPTGGYNGGGIIFSYNNSTGAETNLHYFIGGDLYVGGTDDGYTPDGSLLQASNGLLYGMTTQGGINDSGIIFSYNISTGVETILHAFGSGTDGQSPYGSLIQANNGLLYGTTEYGGVYDYGIIFSYNIATGVETDIHDFNGNNYDGLNPKGSLFQANDGLLYGMTTYGGVEEGGTIFSYNISTEVETVVHSFGIGVDGWDPDGSLIQANNGLLYGMTSGGGGNYMGVIFSYDIPTGTYTDLNMFDGQGQNQGFPNGSLIQGSDGLLYGVTHGLAGYTYGNIFSYNIATNTFNDLHDFDDSDGEFPLGSLIEVDNATNTTYSPVWAGDANDDLIVNNYDLLPIGISYGNVGYSRDTVTNTWEPHPSTAWCSLQADGYNEKFVDCDGDGTINSDDTLAITLNYDDTHQSHSPRNTVEERSGGGAPLYFIADSSLYNAGNRVHIAVWLGNSALPATNIYGLGYDISLDNSLIQPGTISFNYDNSFLGTKNDNALSLIHIGDDVEAAVVGIDHINKNGYGKIGDLYFTLSSLIADPQFVISVSSLQAVDSAGSILTVRPISDTLNLTTTSIDQLSIHADQLSVYPNPNSGQFTINLNGMQTNCSLEVYNVMGEKIYQSIGMSPFGDLGVNLSSQPDGMYFVYLKSDEGVQVGKILIAK